MLNWIKVLYSARSQIALFDAPFGLQRRQTQKMCSTALKAASAHFFRLPRFAPKCTAKNAQFVTALSIFTLSFSGLFMVSLGGCAGLVDFEPAVSTPLPPKRIEIPSKRSAVRELGSLWSGDSTWNEIYSDPPKHVPGDVILVKLTDQFKTQVMRRLQRNYPLTVKSKVETGEMKKEISLKDGQSVEEKSTEPKVEVKVQPSSDKSGPNDSTSLHASIVEVLPRGVYRIAASETLKLGERDPVVTLEGEVRDRDIGEDESVSSDAILNMALELKPFGRERKIPES